MKKVLLMAMCLLLVAGCEKKQENEVKEEPKQVSVQLEDIEVELGEELLNTKGIISVSDGEVVTPEAKVETSVLGEQKIKIVAKNEGIPNPFSSVTAKLSFKLGAILSYIDEYKPL